MLGCIVLMAVSPAAAQAVPDAGCLGIKAKAVARATACGIKIGTKQALRGEDLDLSSCAEKLASQFDSAYSGGACPVYGDAADAQALVANTVASAVVALGASVDMQDYGDCIGAKSRIVTKYVLRGAAVALIGHSIQGGPDRSQIRHTGSRCRTGTTQDRWTASGCIEDHNRIVVRGRYPDLHPSRNVGQRIGRGIEPDARAQLQRRRPNRAHTRIPSIADIDHAVANRGRTRSDSSLRTISFDLGGSEPFDP
jgi:hypothetical protein